MHQDIRPKAPKMNDEVFATKCRIDLSAGCHGALRKGATSKPLPPDFTLEYGAEILEVFIQYDSPTDMPNCGTSGKLNDKEVDLMVRYIHQTPPCRPNSG